jgi:hypothetical protein
MNKFSTFFILFTSVTGLVNAQKGGEELRVDPDSSGVVNSTILPSFMPLLLFNDSNLKEEKKQKKKKAKKNIWFGIKTKKSYTRRELRDQEIIEFFNYTDASRKSDPYIRDVFWFDQSKREIKKSGYEPGKGYLLHGPYERIINEVVVESGMYYYGTKHKTWMLYDSKNILQDKNHYFEGWPRESRITYHKRKTNVIEEIIPVQYGLEEGNYFYFYEDKQIAVTGEYGYGEKVGLWTEYWDLNSTKTIRKREIQYQEAAYTKNFRPYIRAEWDKDGNLIYRKGD